MVQPISSCLDPLGEEGKQLPRYPRIRRRLDRLSCGGSFGIGSKSDLASLFPDSDLKPKSFVFFCMLLIGGFWNHYLDVFVPLFFTTKQEKKV